MQNQELKYRYSLQTSATLSRVFSAFTAALGALVLAALICHYTVSALGEWSPTITAKTCFPFPDEKASIDREWAIQLMLRTSFFGSDALYFDGGEENTGLTEPPHLNPSGDTDGTTPLDPITPPQSVDGTDIYTFDRKRVPIGENAIVPFDLTYGARAGEILFTNVTKYPVDAEKLLSLPYPIKTDLAAHSADEPLILIIHTHGTESYSPDGAVSSPPSAVQRSSNTGENMIAVGKVMANMLNAAGIPTVHCEIMHDLESYTRSYNLAADTIQKYLTKYPSIQYVFDVHRDAIVRTNGDLIRPVTVINGEVAAQIMLLVGTDEMGADHPDWQDNMTVAANLQNRLTSTYSRFARPINVRGASFNEQFTKGSLLIEIGSAANSLEEAKIAAKYLTYSIIDMIKDSAK